MKAPTVDLELELVRRLALALKHADYGTDDESVGGVLGGIDGGAENNEVQLLVDLGLLKAADDGEVDQESLLAFLRAHGATWFLARLDALVAKLSGCTPMQAEAQRLDRTVARAQADGLLPKERPSQSAEARAH